MQLKRSELKAIVKECLKELISEGALNGVISEMVQSRGMVPMPYQQPYQPVAVDPAIQRIAHSMAKSPEEAKLFENIFADSTATMVQQNRADPGQYIQGMTNGVDAQYFNQGSYQPNPYANQYQPQYPVQQYQQPYQPPMQQPQQRQPQYIHQAPTSQPQPPQNNAGPRTSRWASLAFNSPIKNRPDSDSGMRSLGSGGIPGSNMGKFD